MWKLLKSWDRARLSLVCILGTFCIHYFDQLKKKIKCNIPYINRFVEMYFRPLGNRNYSNPTNYSFSFFSSCGYLGNWNRKVIIQIRKTYTEGCPWLHISRSLKSVRDSLMIIIELIWRTIYVTKYLLQRWMKYLINIMQDLFIHIEWIKQETIVI